MKIIPEPCEEYPERARVALDWTWITFKNAGEARIYLHSAQRYLEWLELLQ